MPVKASDLMDSREHHLVQGKSTTHFAEGIQSKSKRAKYLDGESVKCCGRKILSAKFH